MKKQQWLIAGVVGAVVLIAVGGWMLYRPANNENFPEGVQYLCVNPACKTAFTMTVHEVGEHHRLHYGEPIPCPKCKQPALRATKCPSCGKVFPQSRGESVCPFCQKPLPPAQ